MKDSTIWPLIHTLALARRAPAAHSHGFSPTVIHQLPCGIVEQGMCRSGTAGDAILSRLYECKVFYQGTARHLPYCETSSAHDIFRRSTSSEAGPAPPYGGRKPGCKFEHKTYRKVRAAPTTHPKGRGVTGEWISWGWGSLKKRKKKKK